MPRFRARVSPTEAERAPGAPVTLDAVRRLIGEALRPAHFFTGANLTLEWAAATDEEIPWEVFRGRLLDGSQTTQRQVFEAWNVFVVEGNGRSTEPLLSVKLDVVAQQLHVTRALFCYAWEGYHAGDNVYLSRETRKWVRELVGTIHLARFRDLDDLRDELICRLFQAVVGTSRLPLTSVEAPLPAFSFGELAYLYRPDLDAQAIQAGPLRTPEDLLGRVPLEILSEVERAKWLETLLRAIPRANLDLAADVLSLPNAPSVLGMLRTLFNEVSLSPYTDLVDKTLALLAILEAKDRQTTADGVDFLGHLLRQIGRHLTAYDLVVFHHRGANYPDALLLDAVLKAYLARAERQPALFLAAADDDESRRRGKRLRRRALRQGWLLRRRYEGHRVPDIPTSQGENARVLPSPYERVPEEQILQPMRRPRQLFADDPLDRALTGPLRDLLRQSMRDLQEPTELRELGMALFLDRPFGEGKAAAETDQTLLLSYEAFSRSIAEKRLQYLAHDLELLEANEYESLKLRLQSELQVQGIAVAQQGVTRRPSVVSLADALQVADDFILVRSTSRSVADFCQQFDFEPLFERFQLSGWGQSWPLLCVRGSGGAAAESVFSVYDHERRVRLEMALDTRLGYESRARVEYPLAGLRVLRVWEDGEQAGVLREHDLRTESVVIRPSDGA